MKPGFINWLGLPRSWRSQVMPPSSDLTRFPPPMAQPTLASTKSTAERPVLAPWICTLQVDPPSEVLTIVPLYPTSHPVWPVWAFTKDMAPSRPSPDDGGDGNEGDNGVQLAPPSAVFMTGP